MAIFADRTWCEKLLACLCIFYGLLFNANTPADSGGDAQGRFQQVHLPLLAGSYSLGTGFFLVTLCVSE